MRQDLIRKGEDREKKILIILGCLICCQNWDRHVQAFTVDNVDGAVGYVDGVTTTSNTTP